MNSPNASSSNKSGSWARTLFAGSSNNNNNNTRNNNMSSDETNENTAPDSPITSYNQQATNAVLSLLNIHVCCAVNLLHGSSLLYIIDFIL